MSESPSPSEPQAAPHAKVVKALTLDRHVRVTVLDAAPLWDGVRRGHPHLDAEACGILTELMTATALLQSRTLFAERLQILVRTSGHAKAIVADSWPDGTIRGVMDVEEARALEPWIAEPGIFQVMRSNASGQPYIGQLPLVEGGVATQLEAYLQQSEQVQASATLWCDPQTGEAGGLLVEPLPDCPPERLQRLVQALDGLEVVPLWERTPNFLLNWIAQGQGTETQAATDLFYRCRCNRETLVATLSGFSQEQKESLFAEGGPVEVRCDYCGKTYHIGRDEVVPAGVPEA